LHHRSDHDDAASQTFQVPKAEHFIEIDDGSPGLNWLRIDVNGKHYETFNLRSRGTISADLSAAMNLDTNRVTFTGQGRTGSFANINVSDSAPSTPKLPSTREIEIWGHLKFDGAVP
jgi:hypothetical protein